MDIYCQNCGEPWDVFSIQEMSTPKKFHRGEGCPSCHWGKDGGEQSMQALLTSAAYDVLGDDIDGIAAALEDADYMGFFEVE